MTRPSALSIADSIEAHLRQLDAFQWEGAPELDPRQLLADAASLLRHSATVRAAAIAECVAVCTERASEGGVWDDKDMVRYTALTAAANTLSALSPHSPDAKAALVERWQPIATAPMDGTEVLVCRFGSDHYWVMNDHWSIDAECWVDSAEPTHWQPLPAPPAKVPE